MATAREKNGKWYYRITMSSNGKRHYIERGSFRTKREAIDAGHEHELKLKRGESIFVPTHITYGDLVEEWLNSYAPTVYKRSTIITHDTTLRNYILPVLKDYDITAIDTRILQQIINTQAPKRTRNSLGKVRATLSKSFDYAIVAGYLSRTPVEGLRMPQKRSIVAQTLKPLRVQKTCSTAFIEALFRRYPEGHPSHLPLLLGYRCGLRIGEAFGVFMEDVDRKEPKLYIRRQAQYGDSNELYFTDIKYCNPGEYRVIDLDSKTWRELLRQVHRIEECRGALNYKQYFILENGLLNENSGKPVYPINVRPADGSYIRPRTMQRVSAVVHGVQGHFEMPDPDWDFHMLRHTHASECVAAGMPPESVKTRLGHKKLETTYRYYIHETETQAELAKQIVEQMFA